MTANLSACSSPSPHPKPALPKPSFASKKPPRPANSARPSAKSAASRPSSISSPQASPGPRPSPGNSDSASAQSKTCANVSVGDGQLFPAPPPPQKLEAIGKKSRNIILTCNCLRRLLKKLRFPTAENGFSPP